MDGCNSIVVLLGLRDLVFVLISLLVFLSLSLSLSLSLFSLCLFICLSVSLPRNIKCLFFCGTSRRCLRDASADRLETYTYDWKCGHSVFGGLKFTGHPPNFFWKFFFYFWELQLTLGLRSYSTDKLGDKFWSKYCVDAYSAMRFYSISGNIDYVNALIFIK